MQFKSCLFLLAFYLFFGFLIVPVSAEIAYNLDDFETDGLPGGFGVVSSEGNQFLQGGLSPDFELGPFEFGLDLNLFLPLSGESNQPKDFNAVALRHVGFEWEDQFGFRWGRLRRVTFGYGLLIDNYDSGMQGSTVFNSQKAGVLAYGRFHDFRSDVLYTPQSLQAVRGSYTFYDSPVLGAPIIVGGTYATDSDGISETIAGVAVNRPKQEGYGVDIGIPVGGDFLVLYSEYAELKDRGRGANMGFKGSFFDLLSYRAEYRNLGTGFAPGYFNSTYETTSFDFSSDALKNQVNGFLVAGAASFLQDRFKAGLQYEAYPDKNLLTAAFGWKRFYNTVGVFNYRVPFQGNKNAVMNADILYITGGPVDYVVHIKRVYQSFNQFEESYAMGARFNLNNVLPDFLR